MTVSENPATPARTLLPAGDGHSGISERIGGAIYRMIHPLGIHRWRDGYEVDVERGWAQYRGSRCTVCEAPWEGW